MSREALYEEYLDFLEAGLLEDYDTEFEEEAETPRDTSCVTPGNPYILHCFPAHETALTPLHRQHLDRIAAEIVRSLGGSRPITRVKIVGHAATWWGISKAEYSRRALVRAENARARLRGRLANARLGGQVEITVEQRANDQPLVDNMVNSSSSAARHNRALNRRVEIFLIASGGTSPAVAPPLKNIRRIWVHASANRVVGSRKRRVKALKARSDLCDMAPTDVVIGCSDKSSAFDAYRNNDRFEPYPIVGPNAEFQDALDEIRSCGAAIHLFTWITPREKYVKSLADEMFDLCAHTGARSLLLDAEGPWVLRRPKGKTYTRFANDVVKPAFSGRPCCVGITHIVSLGGKTRKIFKRVAPLIKVCDYSLPMAYTSKTGKPGRRQRRAWSNWNSLGKTIVMGLWPGMSKGKKSKGFNLSPAKMAADLCAVDDLGTVEEVYYWWLAKFQHYRAGRDFIREASATAQTVKPGFPPPPLCHIP